MVDLVDDYATCEACGKERIRFVHELDHVEYPDPIQVGCICAEKLTGDYVGHRRIERELRNRASRRQRWLARKWKRSRKGNLWTQVNGVHVGVMEVNGGFRVWIGEQVGRLLFDSLPAAQMRIFDVLNPKPK